MTIARISYYLHRVSKALAAGTATLVGLLTALATTLDGLDPATGTVAVVVALVSATVTFFAPANEPAPDKLDASRVEAPLRRATGTTDPVVEYHGAVGQLADPVVTPIDVDDAYEFTPDGEQ